MVQKTDTLTHLTELLTELPGIGPKSASRIATDILLRRDSLGQDLLRTLSEALSHAHLCPSCHTLTTEESLCPICADPTRDHKVICVVETPADAAAIEASVAYRGLYFVLMGRVNPMNGIGPEELGIDTLIAHGEKGVKEIVIATSYTAEGEMTAHLVMQALKRRLPDVRVTRLARGLPSGVEVEFTDAATLSAAMADRN